MKKYIFRIAALLIFAASVSSCSVELRGHDRPWLGNANNQEVTQLQHS
jgi:hypothetical protein